MILEMDLIRPANVSALYSETAIVIAKGDKLHVIDVIRHYSSEAANNAFPHQEDVSFNRYFVDRFRKGLVTYECRIVQSNRDGWCYHIRLEQNGGLSSTIIRLNVEKETVNESLEFSPYDDCFVPTKQGHVGHGIRSVSVDLRTRGLRPAIVIPSLDATSERETQFWVKDR